MSQKVVKSFKKDFAPMLFYFDLISTKIFRPPILPLPLRIDRLYSGDRTAFIHPNFDDLKNKLNKLDLKLNYQKFITIGLNNFINYAKSKIINLTPRDYSSHLKRETIKKWFNASCNIIFYNPDLEKDLTFIISEFIDLVSYFIHNDEEIESPIIKKHLINHCKKLITYFRNKIENNKITIIEDRKEKIVKLSKERKSKFYPDIIEHDIVLLEDYRVKKMNFIPYLIYDDILDCYSYNKKLLIEGKKQPYNLELWIRNHIINKRSNIKNINWDVCDLSNFDISKVNIDKLI
ncbi:MAG: hypothetical protein EU548_10360 [Promethearchaeota archaeon]|nr:MAG: hypothetical protein EU548_10360 [Candidatus Lokiarchaeota archaeon]